MEEERKCILATGGAGYVGSHTVVELLDAGYAVVVMDNLSNATFESIKRVEELTNKSVPTYEVDLLDREGLTKIFEKHKIYCVIHFAGFKAVGNSVFQPLEYYKNNVCGTVNLLEVMREKGVYNMIFSSSATVYGKPEYLPFDEDHKTGGCTNPYGKTKFFIEEIMKDLHHANNKWNIILLRYFNPIGAHQSGKIGESPVGVPHNLLPNISRAAAGTGFKLKVYGEDYDTPDGTGVRDYTHVVDLAQGHVASLKKMLDGDKEGGEKCNLRIYNLGTGEKLSVLQVVRVFEKVSGREVPYEIVGRRPGDLPTFWSKVTKVEEELKWKAKFHAEEMCKDIWRWQEGNPDGYGKKDNQQQ